MTIEEYRIVVTMIHWIHETMIRQIPIVIRQSSLVTRHSSLVNRHSSFICSSHRSSLIYNYRLFQCSVLRIMSAIHIPAVTTPKTVCFMVRYVMSFSVPEGRHQSAQKVIDHYFDALYKHGPGGMRSQCYADYNNECNFVHIKSFKKESVANQHFKSGTFRDYIEQLASVCGFNPSFFRLQQQQTFESIY